MKNLLIYTNPKHQFDEESEKLVKIQIDNSWSLGWDHRDLLLVTNFEFEYNGVKSYVCDDLFHVLDKTSNKFLVINDLMKKGWFKPGVVYWYHDLDAYQNVYFDENELELGNCCLGMTTYTYNEKWNLGSFFFKSSANELIDFVAERIAKKKTMRRADERVMFYCTKHDLIERKKYKELDGTYNLTMYHSYCVYRLSKKPIRVVHYHPGEWDYKAKQRSIDNFKYGINSLGFPLMSDKLIELFDKYGFR